MRIGQGSCNKVWKAKHKVTGLLVAIKAVPNSVLKRLKRENGVSETQLLGLLSNHPNIINLVEDFEQAGNRYIVTTFEQGCSLLDYLSAH